MNSRLRLLGVAGLLLMASAIALPWAETGSEAQAVDPVSGFGHGIEVVLILAGIGALALLAGSRPVTFLIGCSAATWTGIVMYQLPGRLVSTGAVSIAEMSWGADVAMTGSIVLAVAALPRPRDSGIAAATLPHK
jgi:hypothetical protein